MFLRSLRRSYPLMIAVTLLLVYFTHYYLTGPLIVPPNELGFIARTELPMASFMILIGAFLLPNKFEIELALTCGMSTTKLFFSRAVTFFIYTVIPALAFILLYTYVPYDGKQRTVIGIFVPENYKEYMAVSMFVTLLLFFSVICFIRVLSRNCYVPIFVGLFIHYTASEYNFQIHTGKAPIKNCIFDPFISMYIMGDTVPANIASHYPEFGLSPNAWTYNRLIFFGISVVLLIATYLMLRRERLHRGFGD